MKVQILSIFFSIGIAFSSKAQLPAQMTFNESANQLPVTSGLSLWFDAADAGSIIKDANNKVSRWQDKSGNNNHALQNNTSNQPTYTTSTLNGLPVVYFPTNAISMTGTTNGTYQTIIAVRNVALLGIGYQTLFAAAANSDVSLRLSGLYLGDPVTSNTAYNGDNGNSNDWAGVGNTKYVNGETTPRIPPRPNYHIIVTNSSSARTTTYSLSTTFYGRGMTGGIAEMLVYNRLLNEAERQSIERYLSRKWRITLTPTAITLP